ncbi:recombinase family protein [Rossellomorea sp. GAMAL-10_SWC]
MTQKPLTYHEVIQPNRKAAFYARYSTDKQDFLMQKNAVENFLAEHNCIFLENHQYIDAGVSAVKTPLKERAALQKLKAAAKMGEFDFIAIYKDDRIARDTVEHQQFRKDMNEVGMPVISVLDRELYTSMEVIPRAVKDGMTRMEYIYIRERTADTLRSKQERGEWTGGKAPYGYRYDCQTKTFSLVKEEKQIVIKIFDWFKRGYGFNEIVVKVQSELNDGVQKWSKDKIKMIITNPFYAGYITANRLKKNTLTDRETWKFARNPTIIPIISIEEWEYVMQLYEKKKSKGHNPKRYNTPFILKDIVRCQQCKQLLKTKNQIKEVGENNYGDLYYYCESDQCSLKVTAKKIHDYFKDELLSNLLASSKEKAFNKATQQLIADQQNIKDTILHLNEQTSEKSIQINEMEMLLQEMFQKDLEENEENALFLESLLHYQLFMKKEREQMYNQLGKLKQKRQQLEKAIKYAEGPHSIHFKGFQLTEESSHVQFRKMILELISDLYVDLDGKLHLDVIN